MFDYWDRKLAAVAGPDVARIQQQNRALEHERQAGRTKRKGSGFKPPQCRLTISDIGRVIQHRHNGPCDTAEGAIYLTAVLPSLVEEAGGFDAETFEERLQKWATAATPRLTGEEISICLNEARVRDARGRLHWSAQDLGDHLHLTVAERESLGITTVRPRGMNERDFKAYQRSRKTAAEKARRIAAGAKAREQSDAQMKPWAALGVSRRTFYRARKAMPEIVRGTNSCPPDTKYLQATTGQCHEEDRPLQVPARQASARRSVSAGGHSPRDLPRAVRTGHAVPQPLPNGGVSQPDMLAEFLPLSVVVNTYLGGVMPPELALAVRTAQRARMVTQETVARSIGVSRPQLANALRGRFGLSQSAAANLVRWLEAA
ncbi:hypothetical protein MKK58_13750 [Methylobacterium sp. J-078]|uniref:hypothetical protein n=1 Tax=Methylobacterium sp. J-078 TaxID=2836657 RepID=UPI001FB86EE1|nr:hypothetical protein [Methylobacterium sp. J-078]MCJ2045589.1 hypothetical protein [Methylobacterium sp. J-078]